MSPSAPASHTAPRIVYPRFAGGSTLGGSRSQTYRPSTLVPRILVVDDHEDIREPLAAYLTQRGLDVETAADAAQMQAQLDLQTFDLIVLDIMLPDESGLALCERITRTSDTPVILLTAKAAPPDRVIGLERGADDYVVKPFDPAELLARIRTVMRRSDKPTPAGRSADRLGFDGWTLDIAKRELRNPQGRRVSISEAELQVLKVLTAHPRIVFTREQLLELTTPGEPQGFDRSIDSRISRLRKKLEPDPRRPAMLKTAWGNGYVFVADVQRLS